MKNAVLLMLGLTIGTASFAQTTPAPATNVSVTNDQRVKLIVARESATALISLLDDGGHVLYTETVRLNDGLRQYFDIAALDAGTYQLAVRVGRETVVKTFVVNEQPAQKTVAIGS